jgi:hypothetical protein
MCGGDQQAIPGVVSERLGHVTRSIALCTRANPVSTMPGEAAARTVGPVFTGNVGAYFRH